jgi:DNA primase
MASEIEEIKSRLNIVDVINSYIKLEKAGINYRARCPFHSEKTPSFFVSPSRQLWHCFGGCNDGGDMFKFVMRIEGIEFPDALKILAQRAGVELKSFSPEQKKIKTKRQSLLDLSEKATNFFISQIEKSKTGKEAKEYLLKRGMKEETIKDWRIGYAPDSWQGLTDYLIGQGFLKEDIIEAGLGVQTKKFFDRFRGRIMFPIFDLNSQVIGFTGRIFGNQAETEAKYLNSPNTLLYDKSQALFGMDKAKLEVRKKDFCVLVEGNVDCIMSHQSGVKNCIAVSGTALTNFHLGIIKRYSSNLVLAFDMDLAGNSATKKGIDMALKNGFNVKVLSMFAEKDPADIILEKGDENWVKITNEAKPINQFYFDLAFKNKDVNLIEDKKKIVDELLPIIKKIDNTIEQSYWIESLSNKLMIEDKDIRLEMNKLGAIDIESVEEKKILIDKKTRKELLEEIVLSIAFINSQMIQNLSNEQFELLSKETKEILLKLKENPKEEIDFSSYILLKSDLLKEEDIDVSEEWEKCFFEIESLVKKEKRKEIVQEIKSQEKSCSFDQMKELLEKFSKLTKNNEENNKKGNKDSKESSEKDTKESGEKGGEESNEKGGKESNS